MWGGWTGQTTTELKIVVPFSILGYLVKNVVGEEVEVMTSVGPDGYPHTFEPTPQDGVAIACADVIFENGVGLETWLSEIVASTQSRARHIVVTKGLKLRRGKRHHDSTKKSEPHTHEDDEDPHVWHDVHNVIHMVSVIRDAMIEINPTHAKRYEVNAAAYLNCLQKMHQWVDAEVAKLPKDRRKLVTNHDTFGYFADRYGFEIVCSAMASLSTKASEPSAGEFSKLVMSIRSTRVPAVIAQNIHNTRLMGQLAREAGVKLAPSLYTNALGPPNSPGHTYEKMIRHNVTTIVRALQP